MIETRANPRTRYETSDVPLRLVGFIAAGLFLFIVGSPLLLMAIFPGTIHDRQKAPMSTPPEPRLQANPEADLRSLRTAEQLRLSTYGSVDRERGIVHIPLDEAMRRVARDGIPDWPGGAR
jgi:hypothetical protein